MHYTLFSSFFKTKPLQMLVLTVSHRFHRTHLTTQLPRQVSAAETEHLAAKAEGAVGAGKSLARGLPLPGLD